MNVGKVQVPGERPAGPGKRRRDQGLQPRVSRVVLRAVEAPRQLRGQRVPTTEQETRVTRQDPVEGTGPVGQDPVGVQETDRRSAANVAAGPQQIEGRVPARIEDGRGALVERAYVPHVEAPDLPSELHAADGIQDLARVPEPLGRAEDFGALQEERPLLREEEREAFVDRDLADVRLDLGEVGIVGSVQNDVGRQAHAAIETEVTLGVIAYECSGVVGTRPEPRHDRVEFHEAARVDVAEPHQPPALGQGARDLSRDRRPRLPKPAAFHFPLDLDPPALHGNLSEA